MVDGRIETEADHFLLLAPDGDLLLVDQVVVYDAKATKTPKPQPILSLII